MTSRILVTDGEQRAALAVVRSLGRAGHRTIVCASSPGSLAGASRHATFTAVVPPALEQPERFVDSVSTLVRDHGVDIVLPLTEAAMLALLPARESLGATIPAPGDESFRQVSDKALLIERARIAGIAVPEQQVIASDTDGAWGGLAGLGFPLVLKPTRSVAGRRKLSVIHAANENELRMARRALTPEAYPLLVQRRVVGPGVGIFLLVWDGETRAVFSHRRIREKPPSGGVSVYRESIAADPSLVERSRALLDSFDWRGVAMIEYKVDEATGTPFLMEINGRFWGSLQLAVDAGVDFPALLVALARGERPPPVATYRIGVRSRWWWGDVDHLLARLLHSDHTLALPPDAPGRLRALLDFMVLWRPGDRSEVCRLGDPAPGWRETLNWVSGK